VASSGPVPPSRHSTNLGAVPSPPTLARIVETLDSLYDPSWAESWDAVGLVCGDPDQPVRRVIFAVDPVVAVVDEALEWGADLVVTHHPLYLRGTSSVAATTPKGRVVSRLIASGVALHVAHTNADVADPGVSDALATAIGLRDLSPLEPAGGQPLDKLVAFVPREAADRVIDALAVAGAGVIGSYERVAYTAEGTGTFRPRDGANPAIGEVGKVEHVAETRVEMVLPRARRRRAIEALRSAHPYEEPAYDVIELAAEPSRRGLGRVGRLDAPETFASFVERVANALPATPAGIRGAGPLTREVRTVAVVGGAGDAQLDAVRRIGVDAYVTADLRHHPVSEALAQDGPCLVDAGHWATEWPWLADAAGRLCAALGADGITVETRVSAVVTDAWTTHASRTGSST
jgi:dinuclear metal center YbgI/SA1388 family protein